MDPNTNKRHIIDAVFVICLLLLFLISALTVIAIGASIYKKNVAQTSENYAQRVSTAYVTEKIRQSDANGSIFTSLAQMFLYCSRKLTAVSIILTFTATTDT